MELEGGDETVVVLVVVGEGLQGVLLIEVLNTRTHRVQDYRESKNVTVMT